MATASTNRETVNPAVGALMPKSWLNTGRIACVVYMLAKMKAGAKKSATSAPHLGRSCGMLVDRGALDMDEFLSSCASQVPVTFQGPNSSLSAVACVFLPVVVSFAAAGCKAHNNKLLRTAAGGEES